MARIKAPVVITANDLLTGEVVYLDSAHRWSPELSAAKVFNVLDEAEGELAVAFSEAVVVGEIDVDAVERHLAAERQALERDVRVEHALQQHLLPVGVARREHGRAHVRDEERLRQPPERRLVVARALGERRRAPREAEKDGRDGAARRQAEGPQVDLHVRWRWNVPPV